MRAKRLISSFSLAIALSGSVHGASSTTVHVVRTAERSWHADAQMLVPVNRQTAWKVLTDFERMDEVVPNILYSHWTDLEGRRVLKQVGEVRFIWAVRAEAFFDVREDADAGRLQLQAVAGNFHRFDQEWRLHADDGGVRILYEADVSPKQKAPRWLINSRLKKNIRRSLEALRREMLRAVQ
jgi:carbon monoxide dehydrogenase subunit G